jgi:hypothetical protein
MTGASSVWNAMLGMWNHVKAEPGWEPAERSTTLAPSDLPIQVADLNASPATENGARSPTVMRITRNVLDSSRARLALAGMLTLEGLLACALVDSTTGLVLAREARDGPPVDMDLAAAACAQVLRTHRLAARSMGLGDQVDEVTTSAGARQQMMRALSRHPELFLVALLDQRRSSLALARSRMIEVERVLG